MHPEIRKRFGWDRWTIPIMLGAVVSQLCVAAWLSSTLRGSTPSITALWVGITVLTVGSVLSHWSSMFIHEAAHDNCAPSPRENRFWAIVANTSQVLPAAMTFRKYHLRHHGHLGTLGVDADLPASWEVTHLRPTVAVKSMWVMALFGFWLARGWQRRTAPNRHEVINAVVMVGVDLILWWALGPVGMAYLVGSTLVGHSFHPVAAHFIHEHFVFEDGQETNSYYGALNWVTYNVGYHVEHHDFPKIPGRHLPAYRRAYPSYYQALTSHRSWTWVLLHFVVSSRMGWNRRIVRARRQGGPWEHPCQLERPVLLRGLGT